MAAKPITENTLFYGDNLFILHERVASESIDLNSRDLGTVGRRMLPMAQAQVSNWA